MSDVILSSKPIAELPPRTSIGPGGGPGGGPGREPSLRAAATHFEAAFLTEMLRHAGLAKTRSAFGGGAGEQAFSGSLVQEYATRIADSGGVGLADSIYSALLAREAR